MSTNPHQLKHPDIHAPWSQWSEDQTLHLVSVYSNPFRWRSRREHFNTFRRHMEGTANVRLYMVELAYGDRPFEVTHADHPQDIQLRSSHELWHKENLINLGVQRFPSNYKYGGYCDGDFGFTRHDWALEGIHMLQHHEFVQLFSSYADLTDQTATSYSGHRPYRINSTFAWNYNNQPEFLERKQQSNEKRSGTDPYYGLPMRMTADQFPFGFAPGAPGGAWAWRKSAFDTVGGMLDTCVLGSGDWHMAFGLIESNSGRLETEKTGQGYNRSIREWQRRASKLSRNIGCVDNFAVHHFHGSHRQRGYGDRWQILVKHDFDPVADIHRDWQGVWQLTDNKPRMRDDIRKYFINREEDRTGENPPLV